MAGSVVPPKNGEGEFLVSSCGTPKNGVNKKAQMKMLNTEHETRNPKLETLLT